MYIFYAIILLHLSVLLSVSFSLSLWGNNNMKQARCQYSAIATKEGRWKGFSHPSFTTHNVSHRPEPAWWDAQYAQNKNPKDQVSISPSGQTCCGNRYNVQRVLLLMLLSTHKPIIYRTKCVCITSWSGINDVQIKKGTWKFEWEIHI